MRSNQQCVNDGRDFLEELIAYDMSVGEPKSRHVQASTQARAWCKARGYAKNVGRYEGFRKQGWIITQIGRRKIVEGLPL